MVLFRGDIKCKSLQRRTSISVILPADNIHFLDDSLRRGPRQPRHPGRLFIMASFVGWVSEGICFRIMDGIWVNRGLLLGPELPVYGLWQ